MTVIFLFASLLFMNWKLTLVMVAILPLIAVMVRTASKKFRKQSKKIQVAMGDVTHVASETIQGYRVVRSFGGEAYEEQAFPQRQPEQHRQATAHDPYRRDLHADAATGDLHRHGALMFLVLFLRGDASAGDMVAYITLAGLLPKPIRQLSEVSSTIQKGWPVPKASSSNWTSSRKSIPAPSSAIR
jgi:subfamily B ATP-binding cassette protein MsbA